MAYLETIEVGEAEIEQYDLRFLKSDFGQSLFARGRDDHFVTTCGQRYPKRPQQRPVVVYHQHPGHTVSD